MRGGSSLPGGLLFLIAVTVAAESPEPALVRDAFIAYAYYHQSIAPQGLPVPFLLPPRQREYLRLRADPKAPEGFARLARIDENHWMGLHFLDGAQLLRIRDTSNAYNCRLEVDLLTGGMRVLRGVDYEPFDQDEDAAIAAYLALGYVDRLMRGEDVFVADLTVPPALTRDRDIPSGGSTADPVAAELPAGYVRISSTASIAAAELFAADLFGNDILLEDGDLEQSDILYVTQQGVVVRMTREEMEKIAYGPLRRKDREPVLREIVERLEELAAEHGRFDLVLHAMELVLRVAPLQGTPALPSAETSMDPAGAAQQAFDLLAHIGRQGDGYRLLSGADTQVPIEDLEMYAWMRMQRASSTTQGYPPVVDSGGPLRWGDFALLATVRLARAGVPSKVLIIRKPNTGGDGGPAPYHAVCLFQTPEGWGWMDSGRMGAQTHVYWDRLPALIHDRDVHFLVVDVRTEWLRHVPSRNAAWLISRRLS